MKFSTFIYKLAARNGLKGNWQTPMILSFLSGIFFTACSVLASMKIPNFYNYVNGSGRIDYIRFISDVQAVPEWAWISFYACFLLGVAVAPVLNISLRAYLLQRLQGKEEGLLKGITMRFSVWGKALWLYVRMIVQTFLWGLLLVVPGILAAIRYAMAPFYLAEHPEMSVKECLEASKTVMKDRKAEYALLFVSFLLWGVVLNYAQVILSTLGLPAVLIMVLAQFADLALTVYLTMSFTAYYAMNTSLISLQNALNDIRQKMNESGMPTENREQMEMLMKAFSQSVQNRAGDSDSGLNEESGDEPKSEPELLDDEELPFAVPEEEKKTFDSQDDAEK